MGSKITLSSDKLKREKKLKKAAIIILLVIFLVLLILYFVVGIVYNSGNFSITLDKNLYFDKDLIIYDDPNYKVYRTELYAKSPNTFDNIRESWLPANLDESAGGTHNGNNFLAYTFYIENIGNNVSDYWSEVVIDDVIKNVDEAVRFRLYKNGIPVTYAKMASNGEPEVNTVPFESDKIIKSDHMESIRPGDRVKYTIVLWLEGTDPECNDNILGGEIKTHMEFNSEFVEK